MNRDAITGHMALCSAYNCVARDGCRRYLEFIALPPRSGAGRSFVATSGTKGEKCLRFVPVDGRSAEK